MSSENSAQRLFDLLIRFGEITQRSPNVSPLEIWKKVLSIGDDEIFSNLVELEKLISDVETQLLFDPQVINKTRYLSWVGPIKSTLRPGNMLGNATAIRNSFYEPNGVYMVALEFCCEALSKSHGENAISDETLATLRKNLDDLLSGIRETVDDEKTRAFLLDLLVSMDFGLRNFQVRGPSGLEESLDLALGKLSRQKNALNSNPTPEKISALKKVMSFLKSTGEVVDSSKKIADGLSLAGSAYDQIISNLPT